MQKLSQSEDQALGSLESSRQAQRDNLLSTFLGNRQNPGPPLLYRTVTSYRIGERHGGPQIIAAAAAAMSLQCIRCVGFEPVRPALEAPRLTSRL